LNDFKVVDVRTEAGNVDISFGAEMEVSLLTKAGTTILDETLKSCWNVADSKGDYDGGGGADLHTPARRADALGGRPGDPVAYVYASPRRQISSHHHIATSTHRHSVTAPQRHSATSPNRRVTASPHRHIATTICADVTQFAANT
jgi:hypothetical protein